MKKLGLKKETLVDLSAADLREVAGGKHESHSCTPTYKCFSGGECHSFGCLNTEGGTANLPQPGQLVGC